MHLSSAQRRYVSTMRLRQRLQQGSPFALRWIALALLVALAACAGEQADESATEEPAAAATPEPEPAPRVFFVAPEDGATIPLLSKLQFGAEHFTIEPVGDGAIHENAGHFHIGVDTECLPAGEVIPTADPWIHFGDGSTSIEIELAPGEHTLVLQVGDGEHRTLPDEGLCSTIKVTASEEAAAEPSEEGA